MDINRNNYEEYFLLYADNELSPTERKVVEIFVQENADLKEEFYMIRLTVNAPDEEIRLGDKSFLMKKDTESFIHSDNYSSIFLLYHDNELTDTQKAATEQFVVENPACQAEFELIGKAKLSPDLSIVFPRKKLLYRHEKSGDLIRLQVRRWAAAAVLLGMGLWGGVSLFSGNSSQPSGTAIQSRPLTPKDSSVIPRLIPKEEKEIAIVPKTDDSHSFKPKSGKKDVVQNPVNARHTISAKEGVIAGIISRDDTQETPARPAFQQPDTTIGAIAVIASLPPLSTPIRPRTDLASGGEVHPGTETLPGKEPLPITRSVPDGSDNQNYVFYDVSADEFRKSKVGGFLKKVKRIVDRNNPITRLFEGDDQQVAAN